MNDLVASQAYNLIRKTSILKFPAPKLRIKKLKLLEKSILNHRESILKALNLDIGKPSPEADISEIIPVIKEIRFAKKHINNWCKPKAVSRTLIHFNASASIKYQPKGCVLVISPWNYPFNLGMSPLVSAIAAGNTVVLKPSEFTPHLNQVMIQIIESCFDESEVCVVTGGPEVAKKLTKMPFNHIFFTGSPGVGQKVMEAASAELCSVTLELGGKSPCIVHPSADLQKTARRVIWGKFINCGQTCIAPDTLYVHRSVYKELIPLLKEEIVSRFPSNTSDIRDSDNYGRIINKHHFQMLTSLLGQARKSGAIVHHGGTFNEDTLYFAPTIVEPAPNSEDLDIQKNEIFGPILPVVCWDDEHHLFELLKNISRPLACYIFSRDKKFDEKCQNSISTGAFSFNETLSHFAHPGLPFGGIQTSGTGRAHGFHGFKTFSNEVAVLKSQAGPSAAELLGTPYTRMKKYLIEKAYKYI